MKQERIAAWRAVDVLLAAALLLGGVFSVRDTPGANPAWAWWPTIGFATLLIYRARPSVRDWSIRSGVILTMIIVGDLLGDTAENRPFPVTVLLAVVTCAEAALAIFILRGGPQGEWRRPVRLDTVEQFLRLLAAAVIPSMAGAAVAAGGTGLLTGWAILPMIPAFLGTHIVGLLVLLPIGLARRRIAATGSGEELAVQVLVFAGLVSLTFAPHQDLGIGFLPFLALCWAALRFDVLTVALEIMVLGAVAVSATVRGWGPFGHSWTDGEAPLGVMLTVAAVYIVAAEVLFLPLATQAQQRGFLLRRISADELRFRRNFAQSAIGQVLLRREGSALVISDVNAAAVRIFGHAREQILHTRLDQHLAGKSVATVQRSLVAGRGEAHRLWADVPARPTARIEGAVSRISDVGEPELFALQISDVTAEYEAHRRLVNAEKLTSATLDTTACVILVTDLDGRIIRMNAATTDITGYRESELVGRMVWGTPIAPGPQAEVESLFLWPNRSGRPIVRESEVRSKDGALRQLVWTSNIVRDERGQPTYAVMTGIDVTSERAASGLVTHLMQAPITTALVGVDVDGMITIFNTGAQRMLDFEAHEQIGKPFLDLFDPAAVAAAHDPSSALAQLFTQLGGGRELPQRDTVWMARDGSPRTVSLTLSGFEHADALGTRVLCVARDVTEQRRSQDALLAALEKERTALERLRALDEAKNEFVSTVSHELRTPITSILGYTEMLAEGGVGEPSPEQQPLLATITRNAHRLIDLCNDLLTLSGLDSGNINWQAEMVDVGAELLAAYESLLPTIDARDLDVALSVPEEGALVMGDRSQVSRVLTNLLDNAVKFTGDGGSIRASVEIEGEEVVAIVRDSGIGIPVEEQDQLFQRFFRSSTAQRNAIQGTGLGLSIVHAILEAHGGSIAVRSADGEGSTFTARLPLTRELIPEAGSAALRRG